MKFIFLSVLSLLITYTCHCQFPITDGFNRPILKWDSTYDIKSETFYSLEQKAMIDYMYIVTKENKIVAKAFRHDDSSYFYINYDSSGKYEIQSGLLKMCNEIFQNYTVQVPDWDKDPDGSKGIVKDTIIPDCSYRKDGIWKEKDSLGLSWRGTYKIGLKEGLWRAGHNYRNPHFGFTRNDLYDFNFRTIFSYNYLHGKPVDIYENTLLWPLLKGCWTTNQLIDLGAKIMELVPTIPERCQYQFIDSSKVIIYKTIYNLKRKKSERIHVNAFWKQSQDCIEINDMSTLDQYKVLKLESKRLILQKIKSASKN